MSEKVTNILRCSNFTQQCYVLILSPSHFRPLERYFLRVASLVLHLISQKVFCYTRKYSVIPSLWNSLSHYIRTVKFIPIYTMTQNQCWSGPNFIIFILWNQLFCSLKQWHNIFSNISYIRPNNNITTLIAT